MVKCHVTVKDHMFTKLCGCAAYGQLREEGQQLQPYSNRHLR